MLRNGETGDWIGTFIGHKGAVWTAHLNATAEKAITGSADFTAKLWDAITGEELHNFNHKRIVRSVRFSADSTKFLTGGQEKLLRIYDLNKFDSEPLVLDGHEEQIKVALWVSPEVLISGGGDDTIRVWDLRSMKQVKNISLKSFTNMEITVDGKYLVTSGGKDVSFWDLQKFDKSKDFSLTVDVSSASLSPDGSTLVVGSTDLTVRTYEYGSGKELEILKGHHGPVHCVAFAPDGASFASGSEDGTIRLWQSGEPRAYGLWQENKSSSEGTKT